MLIPPYNTFRALLILRNNKFKTSLIPRYNIQGVVDASIQYIQDTLIITPYNTFMRHCFYLFTIHSGDVVNTSVQYILKTLIAPYNTIRRHCFYLFKNIQETLLYLCCELFSPQACVQQLTSLSHIRVQYLMDLSVRLIGHSMRDIPCSNQPCRCPMILFWSIGPCPQKHLSLSLSGCTGNMAYNAVITSGLILLLLPNQTSGKN